MSSPAFLFDLDGTLVDSVYQHVLAWRDALEGAGIELSVWRIHRRIGMSGGLFLNALLRETGRRMSDEETARVQRIHKESFARQVKGVRPLPGARELLTYLTKARVPWAIATSGRLESARPIPTCSSRPPGGWACRWRSRSSSATACGTCSPRGAPTRSASACSRAATARMSCSRRARIASTRIPRIS